MKKYFFKKFNLQFFAEEKSDQKQQKEEKKDQKDQKEEKKGDEIPEWGKKLIKQMENLTKQETTPVQTTEQIPVPEAPKTQAQPKEQPKKQKTFLSWLW